MSDREKEETFFAVVKQKGFCLVHHALVMKVANLATGATTGCVSKKRTL